MGDGGAPTPDPDRAYDGAGHREAVRREAMRDVNDRPSVLRPHRPSGARLVRAKVRPRSFVAAVRRIVGCIGGILVLGVINNGLLITGVSPYLQKIIKGVIIVVAVVFDMRKVARKR